MSILHDPWGALHDPSIPITMRKSPSNPSPAAILPWPIRCSPHTQELQSFAYLILSSIRSMRQPPQWMALPLPKEVSPGKRPSGSRTRDWFTHCCMQAWSASAESCFPVGSPPNCEGLIVSEAECTLFPASLCAALTSSAAWLPERIRRLIRLVGAL